MPALDNNIKLKYESIYNSFVQNTDGLKYFVDSIAPVAKKHDIAAKGRINKLRSELRAFFSSTKEIGEKTKTGMLQRNIEIDSKSDIDSTLNIVIRNIIKSSSDFTLKQADLLRKSSFIMLTTYFDYLIADLIRIYYYLYPANLPERDLSISLKELEQCKDIGEAIDFLINKQVDKITYEGFEKQKKYFKETLKIDIKEEEINWQALNEAIERRNIIVHNNSVVNRRYIDNVGQIDGFEKTEFQEGDEVRISDEYFDLVFKEFCLCGIILHQSCWRKFRKEELAKSDEKLNTYIYNMLKKEEWICAERAGLFSRSCKVSNQEYRLMLDINYCQSLKWQGKKDKLDEELKKFDISALSPKFRLAIYALKDDSKKFFTTIKDAIVTDKMKKVDFAEWPLFREFRKSPDYFEKIDSILASLSQK